MYKCFFSCRSHPLLHLLPRVRLLESLSSLPMILTNVVLTIAKGLRLPQLWLLSVGFLCHQLFFWTSGHWLHGKIWLGRNIHKWSDPSHPQLLASLVQRDLCHSYGCASTGYYGLCYFVYRNILAEFYWNDNNFNMEMCIRFCFCYEIFFCIVDRFLAMRYTIVWFVKTYKTYNSFTHGLASAWEIQNAVCVIYSC